MEWIEPFPGFIVALLALVAEYVDSSLGMGYGTALTPIMLLLGFPVEQVVPAILMSEFFTGVFAGIAHHKAGNVDFAIRRPSAEGFSQSVRSRGLADTVRSMIPRSMRVAIVLGACSVVGSTVAASLAVSIPSVYVKIYIAVLIVAMGVIVLARGRRTLAFSWKRIGALGILASFNKGMSGGGFGPVMTAGQVTSGVDTKSAVAITSVAEAVTCLAGLVVYVLASRTEFLPLALWLTGGAMVSVPLSALTIRAVNAASFTTAIGIATLGLGLFNIANLVW